MKNTFRTGLASIALLPCFALAQAGTAASKQIEVKRAAWQTWRGSHPNVIALQHTVVTLSSLQNDPLLKVNAKQASGILAVFDEWGKKDKLSDNRAKSLDRQIKSLLSSAQIQAIKDAPQLYTRPPQSQSKGLPGSGRPNLNALSFPWPHDYNPLNAKTAPFPIQRQEMLKSQKRFLKQLKARIGGGV